MEFPQLINKRDSKKFINSNNSHLNMSNASNLSSTLNNDVNEEMEFTIELTSKEFKELTQKTILNGNRIKINKTEME
jgi:hypothetical protein